MACFTYRMKKKRHIIQWLLESLVEFNGKRAFSQSPLETVFTLVEFHVFEHLEFPPRRYWWRHRRSKNEPVPRCSSRVGRGWRYDRWNEGATWV